MLSVLYLAMALNTGIQMPPERFRYEPTQPYTVILMRDTALHLQCKIPFEYHLQGCVDNINGSKIYIKQELSDTSRYLVLVHEKAHLNGWTHEMKE